ncbi:hypothetical protein EJ110_NYTH58128 [Nymphaea thermarum]|nr:hypothetical protein EJ110_NYTH58128 [Nymphaea thermarum]
MSHRRLPEQLRRWLLSHHEGEIVRLPLPPPLESLRRRWSFCTATVAAAVSAPPPSPDLRRRSVVAAAVARSAPAAASRQRRCLLHAVRCPVFLLLPCGASVLVLVMAEEIAPKTDVALDAGIAPKSENLPFQVTPIRLTKDNYLSWSAALEIGITSRGRLPYITGNKPAPSKTDPQWANWALEDSQVKVWIISSVFADIQPLILRKPTSFEMWNVLARMYGRKKWVLCTYQIKRSIYALKQGDLSVASYYATLKTKWEELDYHVKDNWDCDFLEYTASSPSVVDTVSESRDSQMGRDTVSEGRDSQMEGVSVEDQSRGHLFGQVYNKRQKDVLDVVEATNPDLVSSPDDPSPMSDDLPIALRKGTRYDTQRPLNGHSH